MLVDFAQNINNLLICVYCHALSTSLMCLNYFLVLEIQNQSPVVGEGSLLTAMQPENTLRTLEHFGHQYVCQYAAV